MRTIQEIYGHMIRSLDEEAARNWADYQRRNPDEKLDGRKGAIGCSGPPFTGDGDFFLPTQFT